MRRCRWLVSLVTLSVSALAGAQMPRERTGTVAGVVVDSGGRPVANVEVLVRSAGVGARSDSAGAFRLRDVPAGPHLLQVRRIGIGPLVLPLTIAAGDNPEIEIVVDLAVQELPGVDVRATGARHAVGRIGGSDFAERQRYGMGTFFSRARIDSMRPTRVADIIRQARGFRIVPAPYNKVRVVSTRGMISLRGCEPRLFLEGVPVPQDALSELSVDHLEAVEAYAGPAVTPQEFGGTQASCGAVVLWLRVGP
jgi:hypothetical protein